MKPNIENLATTWMGQDYVAEGDFLGQHVIVQCSYDTYQRCWSSKVFRIDKDGQHRLFIPPHEMYSSSNLGSVHRGLRMAKYLLLGVERPVRVAVDDARLWAASEHEVQFSTELRHSSIWKDRLAQISKILSRGRLRLLGGAVPKPWRHRVADRYSAKAPALDASDNQTGLVPHAVQVSPAS